MHRFVYCTTIGGVRLSVPYAMHVHVNVYFIVHYIMLKGMENRVENNNDFFAYIVKPHEEINLN